MMYNVDKLKVVWICHLSNEQIREKLKYEKYTIQALIRKYITKSWVSDFALWNTNAIREFENFSDIELHVISPHYHIYGLQEFQINGVYYHFFKSEDDNLFSYLKYRLIKGINKSYKNNSRLICKLINIIKPDIVHMIGAENPYYGESALLISKKIPFVLSLQTLMNDSNFFKNYVITKESYDYRAKLEADIIKRADYIGSKVKHFRKIILNEIDSKAIFLDMTLAVGVDVNIESCRKKYDFVYFASNISKSIDFALEAYAIAKQQYPTITLHVVGGYSDSLMLTIKSRMNELGLGSEVDFTGELATHNDVIAEIRKARFAILPLKIDLISGTIREAMANGLPVVTTITPATPKLNEKRESVLLSEIGDFKGMADNMCKLLSNDGFANRLRLNAAQTMRERYSNTAFMKEWRDRYYEMINN